MEMLLGIISCGCLSTMNNHESLTREVTDKYGNIYSFGHNTTDEQIAAILAVPTGEILTACNNVHSAKPGDQDRTNQIELEHC